MTREECKKVIFLISNAFPNFDFNKRNFNEQKTIIDDWYFFMSDEDFNDMCLGLKTYIKTSGSAFAPSAAQLIQYANKPKELSLMSSGEAWNMVRRAIGNGAYNSKQEFDALPEIIKKAVGSPDQIHDWAVDENYNDNVVMSIFERRYNTVVERASSEERLPIEAKQKLDALRGQVLLALEGK